MARISLRHILDGPLGARDIITALAAALGGSIGVHDASGRALLGDARSADEWPLLHEEKAVGYVSCGPQAQVLAQLLQHMITKEAETKSLGTEILNLYREVNLIYGFSEKLAALLELDRVVQLTLQEARHLIVATDGAILLLDEAAENLDTAAAFGDELPALPRFAIGQGIIGAIAASGVGEIVNDVAGDPRRVHSVVDVRSLVCAPLKVGERVTGVIVLASTLPMAYTARELKLLTTLALQTATAIENARLFERTVQAGRERERLLALNQEAEVAKAGYERELELAARIQADLFPAALPALPGYDLAARSRPARRCGGDYYDAIVVPGTGERLPSVLLCVADVSGKGLPASLLMSHMQATLRALLGRTATLPDLAANANVLLHGSTAGNKYVTAALLDLVPASGQAIYVSAGHINSLHFSGNGAVAKLDSTGPPLGLLPAGMPYRHRVADIRPGDCVVLCSDGVTDAQNAAGDEFGEDRLAVIVREATDQPASAIVTRVIEEIDRFAGDTPQFDDITLVVLKRSDSKPA